MTPVSAGKKFQYQLLLHSVVIAFGFTGVLGKLINISSGPLVWYRMMIAVLGLALFLRLRGVSAALPWRTLVKAWLVGLIVAAHWILFFESIKRANVSIALVCLATGTFFISFIEPVVYRRAIRVYEVVLGAITALGVGFIFHAEIAYSEGIAIGLGAAFLGAVFPVINGRLVRRYDSRILSLHELAGGFVGITLYFLVWTHPSLDQLRVSVSDVVYLLILGLVCTAFAFIGGVEVMRVLSPFTVLLTINLEPVYGIALAVLVFGESEMMTFGFYLGALTILFTILGNAIIRRRLGLT